MLSGIKRAGENSPALCFCQLEAAEEAASEELLWEEADSEEALSEETASEEVLPEEAASEEALSLIHI